MISGLPARSWWAEVGRRGGRVAARSLLVGGRVAPAAAPTGAAGRARPWSQQAPAAATRRDARRVAAGRSRRRRAH